VVLLNTGADGEIGSSEDLAANFLGNVGFAAISTYFCRDSPEGECRVDFPYTHIIVTPVVEIGVLHVRVPGHALRDLDTSALGEAMQPGDPLSGALSKSKSTPAERGGLRP
jgi:hypothetical protein